MVDPKTRIYESNTLGLPPLKMVLVHARNEAQNAALRPAHKIAEPVPAEPETPLDKERAVRKLIEALESSE